MGGERAWLRAGGSMPCRAPVLGEPRFVPSCASSASPPGPGREGAPGQPTALTLSWPSPPPWQPRSRPDMQPVAPGQPSLRRASAQPGSSPDRDGEIPAPRSLLPCPAELGWGLCLLGRELCALRGVHWGWGLRALGSVCLGWGLCVLQGGVCWGWELGAMCLGGGGVLSGGCSLGVWGAGQGCTSVSGRDRIPSVCLCVGPWMEPGSPSSACQTAPLPGSGTAGADICASSPACLQLAPWHSHSGSWVPPYLSVVSPSTLPLRDTNLHLWHVFLEGKLRQEGGKQQSPLLIPVILRLDPTPHPGLFFPAK